VVVLAFIGNNEHGRLFQAPLNMLPCRTTSHAATFVVSPAQVQKLLSFSSSSNVEVHAETTLTSITSIKSEK
jgi:hypothetical protein